ncbi:hypothetical protein AB0M02_13820 [Actinoplanes sp. NPDC051861]|uniref:hypothetical protein n=1 Tax=Actinoplanes sp. NPDC051861 TaxID=3155170 RepID=UPI00341BE59A
MGNSARRKWLGALVAVQAILVLPVVFVWLGPAQSEPAPLDLYLALFGLPWSLIAVLVDDRHLLIAGAALLNLALTTGLLWWSGRHLVDEPDSEHLL